MIRRSVVAAVLAVPLALGLPAVASAKLVYRCGSNLCQSNDDGSAQKQLTTDGDPNGNLSFFGPDLSADGNKVAFFGQNGATDGTFVLDLTTNIRTRVGTGTPSEIALSPDGKRVAVHEFGGSETSPSVFCYYNSTGGGRTCDTPGTHAGGGHDYTPDGRIVAVASSGSNSQTVGRTKLCLKFADGSGQSGCERDLVQEAAHNLHAPAVSADGKRVAVVWTDDDRSSLGPIAIYDLTTGALVRQLTTNPQDSEPTWTADGAHVIFTRGANTDQPMLFSIEAGGAAGSEKAIVQNARDATAGPPSEIPEAVSGAKVKSAQKGAAAKGTIAVGFDDSAVSVQLLKGKKKLGSLKKTGVKAGTFKFAVKLNGAGKKALAHAGKLKLKLQISVTPPGGTPATVTKSVTLKG